MKAHLLFEQSGTFKNEFLKLGIPAEDYDILNDFGETDHIIDLFKEIEEGHKGEPSIFDTFKKDDIVMAFFPCTRFEDQIGLYFRGQSPGQAKWDDARKINYAMTLHEELCRLYSLFSKMVLIALNKGFRLIVENPYSTQHYLTKYFPCAPKVIDKDRSARGDYYKKPTQYFFINFEPKHNFIFEPLLDVEQKTIKHTNNTVERSLIHPQYANRFIREFII